MGTAAKMSDKKNIGVAVRYWRTKAGMTQIQLAKKINPKIKSKNTVSRIERGESNYTIDRLLKICDILEIDASDLFIFEKKSENMSPVEKIFEEFKAKLLEEFEKK
jgi:transcriptional regulator with XRE-family HTH domain